MIRSWLAGFFLIFYLFMSPVSWAAKTVDSVSAQVQEIEDRLKKVEEGQKELLVKLDEVSAQLDKLKILIRRF